MKKSVDLRPVKPNKTLYANNKSDRIFLVSNLSKPSDFRPELILLVFSDLNCKTSHIWVFAKTEHKNIYRGFFLEELLHRRGFGKVAVLH